MHCHRNSRIAMTAMPIKTAVPYLSKKVMRRRHFWNGRPKPPALVVYAERFEAACYLFFADYVVYRG
jgi:hypothetical protein